MPSLGRKIWKWVAATLAGLLILLAVGVGLFRAAVPMVPALREDAEAMAQRALGWPVHIGEIDLQWALFGPELVLTDVQLLAPESRQPLVSAARLDIIVGPLDLFQDGALRPSHVRLHQPTLALERGVDDELYLSGYALPFAGESRVEWRQLLELGLKHGRLTILDGELHYRDVEREIDDWTLRLTDVTLASDGASHEFEGSVLPPGALGEQVDVEFTAEGAPAAPETWVWTLDFDAGELQLATWYRQLGWTGMGGTQLQGQLDIDGRLRGRGLETVTGNGALRLTDLVVSAEQQGQFEEVAFGWTATRAPERRLLAVHDLAIEHDGGRFEEGAFSLLENDGEYPLEMTASRLPLAELAGLVPLLPGEVSPALDRFHEIVRQLSPRGELTELVFGLEPGAETRHFRIEAAFHDLGVRRWDEVPGVENLTGSIRGDADSGQMTLESRDVRLDFGELFRTPLPVDMLDARLSWKATANGWRLLGRDIVVSSPGVSATATMTLELPDDADARIDLTAKARDVDLGVRSTWLPTGVMSDALVHWLDTAIIHGHVPEATFVLRGPLANYPFRDGSGVFDVRFMTEDTVVEYASGWPRVEDMRADVHFHGAALDIRIEEAGLPGGLVVSEGLARFPDLREGQLEVEATTAGDVASAWQFLADSPLQEPLEGLLAALEVKGPMQARAALDIPLEDIDATKVQVDAELQEIDVRPVSLPWTVEALHGKVRVTEQAVTAGELSGRLTGHPFTASIIADEPARPGNFSPTRIRMAGKSGMRAFEPFLPARWLSRLEGSFAWNGELAIPGAGEALNIELASALDGVTSTLPAPLGTVRPVRVNIALPEESRIEAGFDVQDIGRGRLAFVETASGWNFDRGRLALGADAAPMLPEASGLHVEGEVVVLDIGEWLDFGTGSQAEGGGAGEFMVRGLEVSADRLRVGGLTLTGQAVNARPLALGADESMDDGWELLLAGPATGSVRIPSLQGTDQSWEVDLERLHLPAKEAETAAEAEPETSPSPDPRRMPGLKLDIDDLRVGSVSLGHASGELQRTAIGYTAQGLRLEAPSFVLDVAGRWEVVGDEHYTSISTALNSRDVGDTLAALGYASGIDADDGRIDASLAWHAAPMALDYGLLEGTVQFEFNDGTLSEVNPGAGRLLGLLSIAALPRRLLLDFSDFFSEGLSFDTLSGEFLITGGDAYTTNVQLEGPSVSALLVGRTGLVSRDYDQLAIVDPGVGASLPVAGYLAAGPSVGAALLLLSQLLKAPLADITQVKYRITGSWDDPVIERVQQDSNAQKASPANP